ncbi:hypothetical protein ACKWTF_014166 [Chironomus riparius]
MEEMMLLLASFSLFTITNAINITCSSSKEAFENLALVLLCEVKANVTVTNAIEQIDECAFDKTLAKGFKADGKTIFYLPKGIEKCCNVTEVLVIKASKLKDITEENLKVFPDLKHLDLSHNKLRILENDLFLHNLKLVNIHLNDNEIFAIFPTVFKGLTSLTNLHLTKNVCNPENSNIEEVVRQLSTGESCFNNVSKEELRTTQNLIKTEKIESNALFYYNNPNKMLDLTDEMQEKMNNLNESFSKNIEDLTGQIDRIKRDANTTLEEIKNIIDQMSNNQVNLSYELTNISKKIIQDLDKSAYNQNQIPQNREVKSEIQETNTKLALLEAQINQITKHTYQESININQKLQNSHESPNSTISEITEYINTILLIIIIAVLIVLIFRDRNKSSASRKARIRSSLAQTTTNTQLDVDSSSSVPRNRDFEDNQTYESAQRNNIEQSTGFMPNDVPEYGLNNEIYGKACNEDLYSEVISPKRGQNKDNIDDGADIYAVVYKPERD